MAQQRLILIRLFVPPCNFSAEPALYDIQVMELGSAQVKQRWKKSAGNWEIPITPCFIA
jgi:hypothetical protein